MTIDELIVELKRARWRVGYDAEVRFYTDMTRHAPDDELVTAPEVEADFECEPSNVAIKLYATDPEDTSMAEIESTTRAQVLDEVQAVLDEYAFVATFSDRTQEHVVLSALLETELNRLRKEAGR